MKKNFNLDDKSKLIQNKIRQTFNGLAFDEETHTYTLNGKQLVSVTTYLKRFDDKFNSYHASEAKSKKIKKLDVNDKRDGKYYRKRWKHLSDEASIMGNRIHLFAEMMPYFDEPIDWREQAIIDFYTWLPEKYIVLFQELRVYDKETLHAGTIDGVALNTETGKLLIFDWKTNKRNINELYKNKNLKGEFKDLKATSLNKYSIQLSDYASIIEKNTSFEVEECWIIWLRNSPVNKRDEDRSNDYVIKRVNVDVNEKNFKLYKIIQYNERILNVYKKNIANVKSSIKPAKVKKGLFSKKPKQQSNKSLFSKK